jgi:hypothetical protein
VRRPQYKKFYSEKVTFVSPSPNLPLPNPKLLALHAACARVCVMSGAAEYFDKIRSDMEELPVLAEDGSSMDVLFAKLAQHNLDIVTY